MKFLTAIKDFLGIKPIVPVVFPPVVKTRRTRKPRPQLIKDGYDDGSNAKEKWVLENVDFRQQYQAEKLRRMGLEEAIARDKAAHTDTQEIENLKKIIAELHSDLEKSKQETQKRKQETEEFIALGNKVNDALGRAIRSRDSYKGHFTRVSRILAGGQ